MYGTAAQLPSIRTGYQPLSSGSTQPSRDSGPQTGKLLVLPGRSVTDGPAGDDYRPVLELHVLGGFRLLIDGKQVDVGITGQRLLAAVACRGRQATRSRIAQALWPDTTSERALANLRTALYRLVRRAPGAIHATSAHLQLPVGMQIDLEHTTRLANRILRADVLTDDALVEDVLTANLYDDLLPDWDEEWLADHQDRYRQLRLTTLETLSGHLAAIGHHGASVQAALSAVQADSLRDSAHETLIRAYLAQGNRREAYAAYSTYRQVLRDELGIDPPAAIGRLLSSA